MPPDQPFLSVVIPTKDRPATLSATLDAIGQQSSFEGGFELIVADNGSDSRTGSVLAKAEAAASHSLKVVREPTPGPAAARNAAAAAATGEILVLLGDDTPPAGSTLLAAHAALHREHPEQNYACLGRIAWAPDPEPSEFMRWLDQGGPQFHFWELEPGPVQPENYFYSSHVSLKRSMFERAGGFDRRFPYAAVEDTDLGNRLGELGLTLEFRPELLVWHDHPTTVGGSLRRTRRVGSSAALYREIAPSGRSRIQAPRATARAVAPLISRPLEALARAPLPPALRRPVWSLAHRASYAAGYRAGAPVA